MSRILVTGAAGFIGRALIARLAAEDRPFRAALRRPADGPGESAIVGEIGPDTDWRDALVGIDAVVHLAGRAHVAGRGPEALDAFRRVNAAGAGRLAAQAAAAGIRRFVLVSSIKAAAERSPGRALTEADSPAPQTPYGVSKLEGEQALGRVGGEMETVILRPPLVYGPEVGANFRALLRLVESGLPLPLESVRNRRSLIARDNLVDAILAAIDSAGAGGRIFYVTDGAAISTPDLVRALARALNRPPRLAPFPPALLAMAAKRLGRADAAESLLGSLEIDDSAFRGATGWRPPVSQQDALALTASWYKAAKGST